MRSAHKLCRHIFVMAVMTSVTSTDQFRREAHLYVYAATHNQLVLQEDHVACQTKASKESHGCGGLAAWAVWQYMAMATRGKGVVLSAATRCSLCSGVCTYTGRDRTVSMAASSDSSTDCEGLTASSTCTQFHSRGMYVS